MKKSLFAVALILVMVFTTACAGNTAQSPATQAAATTQGASTAQTTAAAQNVSLRLWLTGPNYANYLKSEIPNFESANPGIKVEYESLDWGSYQQKVLTAVSGGVAPDVVSVFATDTAPFADKNVFLPLDKYIDSSKFVDTYLDAGKWNNNTYTLPLSIMVRTYLYNSDLLKAAGFTQPPQTWDELRTVSKALAKKDDKGNLQRVGYWVPTNHPYKTIQSWLIYLRNNGGDVFDKDGNPIFDSKAGIEAAQLFHDLVQVDKVDIPGTIKADDKDFTQEKTASEVTNIALRGIGPDFINKTDVAVAPYKVKPIVEVAGEVIGITSTTKNPDAAAKLVNYMTTDVNATIAYCKAAGGIPATKAGQQDPYTKDRLVAKLVDMGNKYGVALPKNPQWTEIAAIISPALDKIIIENAPADKTLKDAADKVRALLKK